MDPTIIDTTDAECNEAKSFREIADELSKENAYLLRQLSLAAKERIDAAENAKLKEQLARCSPPTTYEAIQIIESIVERLMPLCEGPNKNRWCYMDKPKVCELVEVAYEECKRKTSWIPGGLEELRQLVVKWLPADTTLESLERLNRKCGQETTANLICILARVLRGEFHSPMDHPSVKTDHDGDCSIYSLLSNGCATDGICTCGFAAQQLRRNVGAEFYSQEKSEAIIAAKKQAQSEQAKKYKPGHEPPVVAEYSQIYGLPPNWNVSLVNGTCIITHGLEVVHRSVSWELMAIEFAKLLAAGHPEAEREVGKEPPTTGTSPDPNWDVWFVDGTCIITHGLEVVKRCGSWESTATYFTTLLTAAQREAEKDRADAEQWRRLASYSGFLVMRHDSWQNKWSWGAYTANRKSRSEDTLEAAINAVLGEKESPRGTQRGA